MYGAFLRSVRTSRGLSQADLADLVGIAQPNLSAYEQDRRTPTLDTLNRILVACGYSLVASGGHTEVACPLPRVGWFPDEDAPPPLPDDPPPDRPVFDADTPASERGRALLDVLRLVEATR